MWSQKTKNGRVQFLERYTNPMTGKTHYVSCTMDKDTRSTRKLAQQALQIKIDEKLKSLGQVQSKENMRLCDLVNKYLEHQNGTVKPSSFSRYITHANGTLRVLDKDVYVNRITASYVRKRITEQDEKPSTINGRIQFVKTLFRWGYENDFVSDIRWLDKLKILPDNEKKEKLEGKYLERDELNLLLTAMKVDRWRYLTELTALSGMRIGEAIALNNEDVDLKDRVIRINKTYDYFDKILISTPKTSTSNREIYIQDELFLLCKQIKAYGREQQLINGIRSELFMFTDKGGYLNYSTYATYLAKKSRDLFNKRISSHYMRHTHVAIMAEQGIPLDVISRRLGHADDWITRAIYMHVTEKQKEKDNALIKNVQIL